jgi:hypothetical protein
MRSYCWQHVCLVELVDPAWVLRRADILTPAIVRMRADAMDCDNAACEVSMKLGTARADVLNDLVYCVCGPVAEHLQPDVLVCYLPDLSYFRVSLGTLPASLDPPLSFIS